MSAGLPEEMLLKPAPRRLVVLVLISLAFVVLGLWVGHEKGDWRLYACAGFFSLGLPVAAVMAVTKTGELLLTREGMEMKGAFNTVRVPWAQVEWLGLLTMHGNKMPSYRLKPEFQTRGNRMARAMTDVDGSVANLYRESPEELLALMLQYSGLEPGTGKGRGPIKIGEARQD